MQYHVDGELVPAEEATVSVRDRGLRYGDSVFETLRAYGGEVFEWTAHERRLRESAGELGFEGAVPDDLALRVEETLRANGLAEAALRTSITRGVDSGLTPEDRIEPTVVITVEKRRRGGREGAFDWTEPATVQTVRTRATPGIAGAPKTGNYLDRVLARLELGRAENERYRADEALVRNVEGSLVGGAASNVFFVADGALKTPSTDGGAFPGITRSVVLELAREEGFTIETGTYRLDALRGAEEAFLTSTEWGLRPVDRADGIEIGDGPMTRLLSRLFAERIERRHYDGK